MLFDELEGMARSGALNADDEVRHGAEDWMRADRTRGLKFSKSVPVTGASHDRSATYVPFGDDAKRKEWYYEILGQEMGRSRFRKCWMPLERERWPLKTRLAKARRGLDSGDGCAGSRFDGCQGCLSRRQT